MNKYKGLIKNQIGASAIVVALISVVVIGFSAIVIDVGYLYEVRRQLQSAADAAALAGAHELILGNSETEILSVSENYAKKNDFPKDIGTSEELWMHLGSPGTEIGENYVKVTVEKNVNLFFARIFGIDNTPVQAQAKAQKVYLTGSKGLVPWGLVIINPTKVTAQLEGSPVPGEQLLTNNLDEVTFTGTLDAPTVARQSGYALNVKVYNGQDFPETVFPAAYINTLNSTDPIKKVWLESNFLKAGSPTSLYVQVIPGTTDIPTARFNGKNYSMTLDSENTYRLDLTAPIITNAVEYFPIDVSIGQGSDTFTITNSAVLVTRRSTYPISSVGISKSSFIEGDSNNTTLEVTVITNSYQKGELYDLKVVQGPETGNFNALDFRYVWCIEENYTVNTGLNSSANDYYDNISGNYEGDICIGDIIETQPGNLSAPQTANSLIDRFGEHSNCTYSTWLISTESLTCRKIILVPIVEKIERMNGKSEVIVVQLAAFFVENIPDQGLNVQGIFIDFVQPGTSSDIPPDSGLYMMSARLVPPDF